ncbi:hypothetical protein GMOD_00009263 [Pyrenophora seminiperda CCB06]|uniref:Uncharacterized protein n=1 Tax=Pyrenophora seminiperda CCB06 TaxID=1302712 RepID=A0A3M7MBL1_9PLEO|nr:hypothetical protein GMOD_00009263 [Pyrenophora seminiperda CCB06]
MERVKIEPDSPEGLAPPLEIEVPTGFQRAEWESLTEGYNCEADEISAILSQRGQGGSQRGRPTSLKVPYKGSLSTSSRAVAQRDRASQLDIEQRELEAAQASDRSAKYQLRKRIMKTPKYQGLSEIEKAALLSAKEEELAEDRYRSQKSIEWLQGRLDNAHKKWDTINHQVAMRKHHQILAQTTAIDEDSSEGGPQPRCALRLFGKGGTLEKIMRKTYEEGLANLNDNSFESKEAKNEWEEFVDKLTPEELSMVTNKTWTQHEPKPVFDLIKNADKVILEAYKPYIPGKNSDECEEEVDDDSEIDDYFNQQDNEYETEEQWEEVKAEATQQEINESDRSESEFEGFSDSEFEGFSD